MALSIRFIPTGRNFGEFSGDERLGEVEVRNQNGFLLIKEVVLFSTYKNLRYILKSKAGEEMLELLRKLDSACNKKALR